MPRRALLERVATYLDELRVDYLVALDWGACATDPDRALGKGDGEHVHALVLAPDWDRFAAGLHQWAKRQGIGKKARDWTIVSGWCRHRDAKVAELRRNVLRVFAYMMKPPRDGRRRDLGADVRVRGVFAEPWDGYIRNATGKPAFGCTLLPILHAAGTSGRHDTLAVLRGNVSLSGEPKWSKTPAAQVDCQNGVDSTQPPSLLDR